MEALSGAQLHSLRRLAIAAPGLRSTVDAVVCGHEPEHGFGWATERSLVFGRAKRSPAGGAEWPELPGADTPNVLCVDRRQFSKLRPDGVGYALVERTSHGHLVAS